MNIREAILKAADHIEANPSLYQFQKLTVPECGTPGCLVGLIGFFMGVSPGTNCWGPDSVEIVGVHSNEFCDRIDQWNGDGLWPIVNAADAAICLRRYADKYHPEQFPEVRKELDRIFARPPAEQTGRVA